MKITKYEIEPNKERNIKISLMADLHGHLCSKISASPSIEKPDYIVIVGDLVD